MRQQAIAWTCVDQDLWCHMTSLGNNELISLYQLPFYDMRVFQFLFVFSLKMGGLGVKSVHPNQRQYMCYASYRYVNID